MHNTASTNSKVSAAVAVIGLGKIGLPLAVQYALHDRTVIGCDIDPYVVKSVNEGRSHVHEEPGLADGLADAASKGLLSATCHTSDAVRQAGVVIVIVPVDIDSKHQVNFEVIDAATTAIAAGLQPGTLVIYETTLPVGTTTRRLAGLLEQTSQLEAGRDFFLAFSPERVSSGYVFRDLSIYPKIVGGINEESTAAAVAFYRSVLDAEIITVASADDAEFVKLIETTYRDVNIALANEFACYADVHGLDIAAAIAAANTQPYSHIHTPGVGVGGHCIPVYPYFLLVDVEDRYNQIHHSQLSMLLLPRFARRINDAMAEYTVRRIEDISGSLAGQSVLILGVAYRGDVREVAFTSAKLLQDALVEHGATVYADDPLFSADELHTLGYTPLTPLVEDEIRAIILQADHKSYQSFDFSRFVSCQVVLDGRKVLSREKIELFNMRYVAIGDGVQEQFDRWEGDEAQRIVQSLTDLNCSA